MFYTKNWGVVSSKAELKMLAKAEQTFEREHKKKRKRGGHKHERT